MQPTVSFEPTVSPQPTSAPSISPVPTSIPSTYHPTWSPTSSPTSSPTPFPTGAPSASPYPTVTSAPTRRRAVIDVKFNAIMAYVNATEIDLPEACVRCAAARAALAQAFANALDVPTEWIVSIEARSMNFYHDIPRPARRRLMDMTPRPRPARRLADEAPVVDQAPAMPRPRPALGDEAPVVDQAPGAADAAPAMVPSVSQLADDLRARQLSHFDWHTQPPTYTPAPSFFPTPAPSQPPTNMFWPTRAPTFSPTILPNVTMVGAVATLVVADAEQSLNVTTTFIEQALIDLSTAVWSGAFLNDVRAQLVGTAAADIFEDAVILQNQTDTWNRERCADRCYDLTVTSDRPTTVPTTSAPSLAPTACGLTVAGLWWPCEVNGWPLMPWKLQTPVQALTIFVVALVLAYACFVMGKKLWVEYRDDATKIYRDGPYYRNVAKAFVRESALECASTPWYVRDAVVQWWKMIFQVTEMDVRPWPGRVASEKRVCVEGQLQG